MCQSAAAVPRRLPRAAAPCSAAAARAHPGRAHRAVATRHGRHTGQTHAGAAKWAKVPELLSGPRVVWVFQLERTKLLLAVHVPILEMQLGML